MAIDSDLVTYLRDFYDRTEINRIYQEAGAAYMARLQDVTITAHSLGDSNSSGQISGNPRDLMLAAKGALNAIDGIDTTGSYAVHQSFGARMFET